MLPDDIYKCRNRLVGGKVIGEIRVGMAAKQRQPRELERQRKQARHLGHELVARLPVQAPSPT